MKPGERIEAIKKASEILGLMEWRDIDLTLRTFGFNWTDNWQSDDRVAYCMNFLEQGSDQDLASIFEYLTGAGDNKVPAPASELSEPWKPRRFRLFISHISMEKKWVGQLRKELDNYGIDGFVAHEIIEPTREWVDEIEKGLNSCDALAAILHEKFHSSNWTDQEVGVCVGRKVPILPVMIGMTPYGFIGKYQGLKVGKMTVAEVADKIFDILANNPLTAQKIAEAAVSQFEESQNFRRAIDNSYVLQRVTAWNSELLTRISTAKEKNSQVEKAHGMDARVNAILRANTGRTS